MVVVVVVIGVGNVIRGLLGIIWRFIGVIVGVIVGVVVEVVGLWVISASITPSGFIIVWVIISFIIFSIIPFTWIITSSIPLSTLVFLQPWVVPHIPAFDSISY